MADSMYQQPFTGRDEADETEGEDVVVEDEELLTEEQAAVGSSQAPGWSTNPRASRRAPRSTTRAGSRAGDLLAGKYLVERVRGRTGPEVVVYARHLELGQQVLLRYLMPEASASPEAVARFQQRARKAREMRSEHAERVIDFGRLENGSPYRVTEMPGGPSLAEMLRVRGALPIAEAIDIVVAACEPVAEAHASGVIHRSLCTSSIFVERRPDGSQLVKVLDFGVSDALQPDPLHGDGLSVPGAVSTEGSLAFASPEQVRNPGTVDARADIWALGAIVYELLTGVRTFEADTPLSLLAMIAADQPAPIKWLRPEVPEALERLVLACLEKDPDGRPRNVVELAMALAPYGTGEAHWSVERAARLATRSTRPPPLPGRPLSGRPSMGPHSGRLSQRTSAIVRTGTPDPFPAAPVSPPLPGWAMLTGGALIGISAALAATLMLRPARAPEPVAQPVAQPAQPVAQAAPPAAPVAPPVAATPSAAVEPPPAPVAAPAAPAPVAAALAARRVESKPAPAVARETRAPAPKPERAAPAAAPVTAARAPAKGLFGGVD